MQHSKCCTVPANEMLPANEMQQNFAVRCFFIHFRFNEDCRYAPYRRRSICGTARGAKTMNCPHLTNPSLRCRVGSTLARNAKKDWEATSVMLQQPF